DSVGEPRELLGHRHARLVLSRLLPQLGDDNRLELGHVNTELEQLLVGEQHGPAANPVRPGVLALPRRTGSHDRVTDDLLRNAGRVLPQVGEERELAALALVALRQVAAVSALWREL